MRATPRLASIDSFRGFAVMLMALGSHLFTVDSVPPGSDTRPMAV